MRGGSGVEGLLNLQPHVHMIVTSGAFDLPGARLFALPAVGLEAPLEELVRARVLRELSERGLLSRERLALVRSWRHSGFSVHVGREIPAGDKPALERLARYLRRLHHSCFTTRGSSTTRSDDARDLVAEVVGFVPDTYQHESVAYGEYANV